MEKSIIDVIKEKYIEEMENYFMTVEQDHYELRRAYIHSAVVLEELLKDAGVSSEEIEELDRQARENVRGK